MTSDAARAGARALPWAARASGWLRGSRAGLFVIAVVVGVGSGFGAVAFRYLIYFFTWLVTGHVQFGQDGHVGSSHLPWLGLGFFVVIPVVGGFVYGPLIYRWAREARGHGVPEVMVAVAENGGRIRPQVSVVKAVASAICIGVGGSVGREGPIVQIGSALASTFGQWVRMPENRMRILVACGAAGGISATFNAPITGLFFGVEIILREFSVDALFTVMLSAMLADAVAIPILGNRPFLNGFPPGIALHDPRNYVLVALLAVVAALIGLLFSKVVYKMEDLWDLIWKGRPEWARPGVGGIALGLVLLALPQMYGVGYPVMYKAVAGDYALWFLLVLAAGKIIACSLTLGIGGSGGIFAPSLFIGATSGMAFGETAVHVLGPGAGQPALYAVVAMGAVFASAARAPLTSVASVVEMTGDYALTLPVLLAVAIATALSRALSYGTIYTTKLLRRGQDIDRAAPWRAFGDLKAADAMQPFPAPLPAVAPPPGGDLVGPASARAPLPGPVTHQRDLQAVFAGESLAQTLRQLDAYGRDGLPVMSGDGRQVQGWITNASVLQAVAREIGSSPPQTVPAQASRGSGRSPRAASPEPSTPLPGYQVVEVTVEAGSPASGRALGALTWPPGYLPVSVLHHRSLQEPDPGRILVPGDRVSLLAPAALSRGRGGSRPTVTSLQRKRAGVTDPYRPRPPRPGASGACVSSCRRGTLACGMAMDDDLPGPGNPADPAAALAERLRHDMVGALELFTVYLGERLGLYRALAADGPATSAELAGRTGTAERYIREWLEHQAASGLLDVDDPAAGPLARRYRLPPTHARVLADPDDVRYQALDGVLIVRAGRHLPQLAEAFRSGDAPPALPWAPEGRPEYNRAAFLKLLGTQWLPAIADVDRRLRREPPARVADLACGAGWSSIAIAQAYPLVRVDGFDLDPDVIAVARHHAEEAGVSGQVAFSITDASGPGWSGRYDLVTIFEGLHDMSRPVDALRAARGMLTRSGSVVIADELVADEFTAPASELERYHYGWSVVSCLPAAMGDPRTSATGAVMRPATLRRYAQQAGFADVEVLPLETETWRFYRLTP